MKSPYESSFRKRISEITRAKRWELKRIKGSHHVYVKSGNPARISVPIHKNMPLKIGLLKHLLKIAEINEEDL